jgi:hypothetical protein
LARKHPLSFWSVCRSAGSLFIFVPDGTLLGRFDLGTATGNFAWGDDGSTLFITSNTHVYRIRLSIRGVGTTVQGFRNLGEIKVFKNSLHVSNVTKKLDLRVVGRKGPLFELRSI